MGFALKLIGRKRSGQTYYSGTGSHTCSKTRYRVLKYKTILRIATYAFSSYDVTFRIRLGLCNIGTGNYCIKIFREFGMLCIKSLHLILATACHDGHRDVAILEFGYELDDSLTYRILHLGLKPVYTLKHIGTRFR